VLTAGMENQPTRWLGHRAGAPWERGARRKTNLRAVEAHKSHGHAQHNQSFHFQAGAGGVPGDTADRPPTPPYPGQAMLSNLGWGLTRRGGNSIAKAVTCMEHLMHRDILGNSGKTPPLRTTRSLSEEMPSSWRERRAALGLPRRGPDHA
jgi:hypothetical protein